MNSAAGTRRDIYLLLGLSLALFAWRLWIIPQLGITLYVDEAQYWTWAQHLAWGYFSKPPGVAALIWLSTALFGDGLVGVKALSMLCYPAAAAVCWAIARRLYDGKTAFWSTLVILTLPIFAWLDLFVSTDALLTLFWTLALWLYLRALERDRWLDWLGLGAVCGLGLLSKYTMAAWLGAAFLHLLACHRPRLGQLKPWLAFALALLILSPNIAWNVAHDFPTLKHTAAITLNKINDAGGPGALSAFWAAQWICFGPLLGGVFFLILARPRQSWRDTSTRLLFWFALPLWAVVSLQALKSGANPNWAAPAFAPASIAIVGWLLQRGQKKLLLAGLAINLAVVGLVYEWPQLMTTFHIANSANKNPYKRAMGWDDLGRQLRPIVLAHPDCVLVADTRALLAHMHYELRDLKPEIIAWNPSGVASDHYKMTSDLRPYVGRDILLISEEALGNEVAPRFAGIESLPTLRAQLDEQTTRDIAVHLLHGFKGY